MNVTEKKWRERETMYQLLIQCQLLYCSNFIYVYIFFKYECKILLLYDVYFMQLIVFYIQLYSIQLWPIRALGAGKPFVILFATLKVYR